MIRARHVADGLGALALVIAACGSGPGDVVVGASCPAYPVVEPLPRERAWVRDVVACVGVEELPWRLALAPSEWCHDRGWCVAGVRVDGSLRPALHYPEPCHVIVLPDRVRDDPGEARWRLEHEAVHHAGVDDHASPAYGCAVEPWPA